MNTEFMESVTDLYRVMVYVPRHYGSDTYTVNDFRDRCLGDIIHLEKQPFYISSLSYSKFKSWQKASECQDCGLIQQHEKITQLKNEGMNDQIEL